MATTLKELAVSQWTHAPLLCLEIHCKAPSTELSSRQV